MLKNYLRKRKLKRQGKDWDLYDETPEFEIEWIFAFIDQLEVCGHFNCPIAWNYQKHVCNAVIVINLNNRVNEEAIINSINHEALHAAMTHCLRNPAKTGFIESVINDWLMGEHLVCNTWEGAVEIHKREHK